jgi:hypothetical protein
MILYVLEKKYCEILWYLPFPYLCHGFFAIFLQKSCPKKDSGIPSNVAKSLESALLYLVVFFKALWVSRKSLHYYSIWVGCL